MGGTAKGMGVRVRRGGEEILKIANSAAPPYDILHRCPFTGHTYVEVY